MKEMLNKCLKQINRLASVTLVVGYFFFSCDCLTLAYVPRFPSLPFSYCFDFYKILGTQISMVHVDR